MRFCLYADPATACAVRLVTLDGRVLSTHPMRGPGDGYFMVEIPGVGHGVLYKLVVDDRELPDPFARFLPQGVNGPAMVMVPAHPWRHGRGVARPLSEQSLYELHVGTFSDEGTYDGVRKRLPDLVALGITTVELMPVAAFAGQRGWGYDGVALFAPFAPYGTPDQLRALVDEAHGLGLSMILDVVYNHFGPAGNYLPSYSGRYFTREERNAWGDALDYAHAPMRQLVLDNALYWLEAFRFDGLRLDATHAIVDRSPRSVLDDLADAVKELAPRKVLIAEDERNDATLMTRVGLDAVWADDFHHAVRVSVTGERDGYYAAYEGGASELARIINQGWLYQGQTYPPTGKARGTRATGVAASAFVFCIQNHDQVGNRAFGDRLSRNVPAETYRAVSTLLLFLPMTPLLFMGQEWAASSPFLFFTDHDEALGRLVSQGRREEFKTFAAFSEPSARARIPDPQDVRTFEASRLDWDERGRGAHARTLELYRALLRLRRSDPVLRSSPREGLSAEAVGEVLVVRRVADAGQRCLLLNLGATPVAFDDLPIAREQAEVIFDSEGPGRIGDPLAPHTAIILGVG